jgi:hypothetical protein
MSGTRRVAVATGVLFIVATAASIVSTALMNPILSGTGYLAKLAANQNQVIAGAFFLLIAGFTSAGIAMSLYPVLQRHGEGLSIGSVGLRIIEGAFYSVAAVAVLALVTLSAGTPRTGIAGASLQVSGALLLALRDRANLTGALAFYVGGLMYYVVFYRSRLVPRWLSVWGIAGVTLGFIAGILALFQVIPPMATVQVVLNLPIAVQEMVLAVWLIAVGFSPATAHAELPQSTPGRGERK